jgi:hypothetical protein
MASVTALTDFMFRERQVLAGEKVDMDDAERRKYAGMGFVALYETKVQEPVEKKPSAASQAAPARRSETRKKPTKKAK